ncbi:hypothetical protein LguiB_018496 [Lonicera macranthoides]
MTLRSAIQMIFRPSQKTGILLFGISFEKENTLLGQACMIGSFLRRMTAQYIIYGGRLYK